MQGLCEEPVHGGQRLRNSLDHGDPDLDTCIAEPLDIQFAVLLLVGHHEVRLKRNNRAPVRVLRASDTGDVEIGRVGTPVRDTDQRFPMSRRYGFCQGGDQGHDPLHGAVDVYGTAHVVSEPQRESLPALELGPSCGMNGALVSS